MVERTPTDGQPPLEDRIVPFRKVQSLRPAPLRALVVAGHDARALRLRDVVMLLPIIVPVTAMILLGLLGWFVAWLAIVGMLVTAIVVADFTRAILGRRHALVRALDRRAVS